MVIDSWTEWLAVGALASTAIPLISKRVRQAFMGFARSLKFVVTWARAQDTMMDIHNELKGNGDDDAQTLREFIYSEIRPLHVAQEALTLAIESSKKCVDSDLARIIDLLDDSKQHGSHEANKE